MTLRNGPSANIRNIRFVPATRGSTWLQPHSEDRLDRISGALSMARNYGAIAPVAGLAVFYTRLTLSVIDATGDPDGPQTGAAVEALADWIIESGDGYAARDLLHYQRLANGLSGGRARGLKKATNAAALDLGNIPAEPLRHLTNAVDQAESVIGNWRTKRDSPTSDSAT